MKTQAFITLILICSIFFQCRSQEKPSNIEPKNIEVLANEEPYHYYLAFEPSSKQIDKVLLLLPGAGQIAQSVSPETELPQIAAKNNILCIVASTYRTLFADEAMQENLTNIILDVMDRFKVKPDQFVLGGFSAGGAILTRYTELCYQYPERYPIQPKGVFTVDSPLDLFTIYENFEESKRKALTKIAVNEANWCMKMMDDVHGVPRENKETYAYLSPFCMDKSLSENEQYLMNTSIRCYHDVDINWRLKERNQPVRMQNYLVSAELINRLLLKGHTKAEFIQTFQTGYRSDGRRHPHSWSIVDAAECIEWIQQL